MTITDIDPGEQREALANRLVGDLSASMETTTTTLAALSVLPPAAAADDTRPSSEEGRA